MLSTPPASPQPVTHAPVRPFTFIGVHSSRVAHRVDSGGGPESSVIASAVMSTARGTGGRAQPPAAGWRTPPGGRAVPGMRAVSTLQTADGAA